MKTKEAEDEAYRKYPLAGYRERDAFMEGYKFQAEQNAKLREALEQVSKDLTDLRVLALKTLGMDNDSVKIERGLYDIDMKICKALDGLDQTPIILD